MIAPVILSVVAFIAGKPVTVQCDQNLGGYAKTNAVAATPFGGSVIYVIPRVCDNTRLPLDDERAVKAIGTFIHEAAHVRGYRRESCAEMMADIGVYDVLRRYYKVPFFSGQSVQLGRTVRDATRLLPPAYQIESCWNSGPPS